MKKVIIPTVAMMVVFSTIMVYTGCIKTDSKVKGCTDANACNYKPSANEDDGSCVYQPTGTATTSLNSGGLNGGMIDFHTGATDCECSNFTKPNGTKGAMYFSPFNFTVCNISNNSYGVNNAFGMVDVGAVTCLGEVKTKPSSGYLVTVGAVIGHGYVIKLGDSTYVRMYCDRWIENTSGGVVGVQIKWQYPF